MDTLGNGFLQPQATRSQLKCQQCRRKKVKCLPVLRDWTRHEQCLECQKSGHRCGPNVRATSGQAVSTNGTPVETPLNNSSDLSFLSETVQLDSINAGLQLQEQSIGPNDSICSNTGEAWVPSPGTSDNRFGASSAAHLVTIAQEQLNTLGSNIEFANYLHSRLEALRTVDSTLPLYNCQHLTQNLHCYGTTVCNQILTVTREIKVLAARMQTQDTQHIQVELLNTAQLLNPAMVKRFGSYREEIDLVREELILSYQNQRHHSAADRLRRCVWPSRYKFLQDCGFEILSNMSQRLRSTAEKIRKDLNLYYLASDFAGNMEISATQLALLSCRNNNTIEPQLCIPSPELDLLGRNIFHIAAETADLTWLRQAIKTTPDILKDYLRERDFMGFTPHMVAAYTGSADVFNFFVKAGCDLKLKDPQGRDALCLASMAGHEMIVSSNIQHGITVQDCFPMHSPIWDAAAANRRPVVELLLENKAEPCFEHDGLRASAIAFKRGHIELSTFLAEKEEQRDKELSSPKHDAIGRGLRTLKRKINEAAHLSRSPSRNGAAGQSQPSPKSATHKRRRSTRSSSQPLETRIDDVNPMSTTQDATDLGELFSDMVDLAGSHYTDPIPAASATFCDSSANLVFTNPTAILPGLDDSWDTLHDQ